MLFSSNFYERHFPREISMKVYKLRITRKKNLSCKERKNELFLYAILVQLFSDIVMN